MDQIEQAVVQGCIRELHSSLGFKDSKEINHRIIEIDSSILEKDASNWLYGRPTSRKKADYISMSALRILSENSEAVIKFYRDTNPITGQYLAQLMLKYMGMRVGSASDFLPKFTHSIADIIFRNWTASPKRWHGSLSSGIYQTFRRYKPTRSQKMREGGRYDSSSPENHIVICELIYMNLERMECRMVTGDLNVYFGSLCITHEDVLYGILQRPSDNGGEIHQRFLASKVERPSFEMYSGIFIKIGNISIRPIASEFLFMPVPKEGHIELYSEFDKVNRMEWQSTDFVEENSVIANYIAITPPRKSRSHPDWRRVRYVRDFPILDSLSKPADNALFREPIRTLSAETLNDVLADGHLDVFQQHPSAEAGASI